MTKQQMTIRTVSTERGCWIVGSLYLHTEQRLDQDQMGFFFLQLFQSFQFIFFRYITLSYKQTNKQVIRNLDQMFTGSSSSPEYSRYPIQVAPTNTAFWIRCHAVGRPLLSPSPAASSCVCSWSWLLALSLSLSLSVLAQHHLRFCLLCVLAAVIFYSSPRVQILSVSLLSW